MQILFISPDMVIRYNPYIELSHISIHIARIIPYSPLLIVNHINRD